MGAPHSCNRSMNSLGYPASFSKTDCCIAVIGCLFLPLIYIRHLNIFYFAKTVLPTDLPRLHFWRNFQQLLIRIKLNKAGF